MRSTLPSSPAEKETRMRYIIRLSSGLKGDLPGNLLRNLPNNNYQLGKKKCGTVLKYKYVNQLHILHCGGRNITFSHLAIWVFLSTVSTLEAKGCHTLLTKAVWSTSPPSIRQEISTCDCCWDWHEIEQFGEYSCRNPPKRIRNENVGWS